MGEATPPLKENKMKTSIQKGHCQVCGSVQRIHNNGTNKIFNHGFTRSGGFGYWTSAPCWGSSHQALEISCDIVEDTIARAYDIIEKIEVRVTAQEEEKLRLELEAEEALFIAEEEQIKLKEENKKLEKELDELLKEESTDENNNEDSADPVPNNIHS